MKNNIDLVKHCELALNQKWGYVWGTFGQVLTQSIYNQKLRQYPSGVGRYRTFIRQNWLNKRTADCIGLIKSYLWWNNGRVRYTASQDKSANGMYSLAREKGNISRIPEIPGLIVWKKGHVGVYIGNGQVIEARGTTAGVIKSPLKGSGSAGWTNWFKCPYINYVEEKEEKKKAKVKVNVLGRVVELNGFLKDGTNYVEVDTGREKEFLPIRNLAESIGLKVSWDKQSKSVMLK